MLFLWIIPVLILLFLSWLLFSRITLEIDTQQQMYRLSIEGIGNLRIVPAWESEEFLIIRLNLWFWKKLEWPISSLKGRKRKTKGKRAKVQLPRLSWKQFRNVLSSFKIVNFRAQLSNGNPISNAIWFPIIYGLNRGKWKLEINFRGENSLQLIISNRLIHLLIAWIKK